MKRHVRFGLAVFTLLALLTISQRGHGEPANRGKEFMRAKLVYSQQVLEAIALEDYTQIAKNAEQIRLLSLDESWQVMQTEEYARHSADFRNAAAALGNAGKSKNLDGAVLGYFQMTQSCVHCHRYLRQAK